MQQNIEALGGGVDLLIRIAITWGLNALVMWIVTARILRRDEATFPRCIVATGLLTLVFYGSFVAALGFSCILAIFGPLAVAAVFIPLALFFSWKGGNWVMEQVFDWREGQGRTPLALFLVFSIAIQAGTTIIREFDPRDFEAARGTAREEWSIAVEDAVNEMLPDYASGYIDPETDQVYFEGYAEDPNGTAISFNGVVDGRAILDGRRDPAIAARQLVEAYRGTSEGDAMFSLDARLEGETAPVAAGTPPSTAATPTVTPPPFVPAEPESEREVTMKRAEAQLEKARASWDAGKPDLAILFADRAVDIYRSVLPEDHPKIAEIERMISAAEEKSKSEESRGPSPPGERAKTGP